MPAATEAPTAAEPALPGAAAAATASASATPEPAVAEAPKPKVIQIRLNVEPASARIELDGTVTSGLIHLPQSDEVHRIEVSAPGYVTLSQELHADADQQIAVLLEREKPTMERPPSSERDKPSSGRDKESVYPDSVAPKPRATNTTPTPAPASTKRTVTGPLETSL